MPNLRERARRVAVALRLPSLPEPCRAESRIERELISLVRECIVQIDGNGLGTRPVPEAVEALHRLLMYAPQRGIRVAQPATKTAHEE